MDTLDSIQTRRSSKRFDPAFRIPESDVERLLSLAALSPTAFNIQHWRFVRLTDPELREAIRAVTWMQPQITEASLLLVLCADLKAWEKLPERYWRNASEEGRGAILEAIRSYYDGDEQLQRDEAMRSCGIAAQTLMLAATAMGYDSSPMDLSDLREVGRLIDLPEDHAIAMFIAIGKRTQEPWPRGGQLGLDDIVFENRFV